MKAIVLAAISAGLATLITLTGAVPAARAALGDTAQSVEADRV